MNVDERTKLRIEFTRETEKLATDNIPEYADWLENKLVKLFAIPVVVGQSEQLRACKKLHKCSNPGVQCRDGKYYACYE